MISEDYCSQEVFQLLREKGFPVGVGSWSKGFVYDGEGYVPGLVKHENSITHQMAMKWLREVHHIVMSISPTCGMLGQFNGYLIIIDKIVDGVIDNQDEFGLDTLSYEEAVEAAIKYSLENLIL